MKQVDLTDSSPNDKTTLIDKIKTFSPQQTVEKTENYLANLGDTKRKLLGVTLIVIGVLFTSYSFMHAHHNTKTYLKQWKDNQAKVNKENWFKDKLIAEANLTNQTNQANQPSESVPWREVSYMLASTPGRRTKVLEKLAFSQKESVILAISLTCPECIKLAVELNSNPQKEKLLAVAIGTDLEVKEWKEKLGISYEVKAISEDDMGDLGVALFPTLIKVSKTVNPKNPKSLKSQYQITATSDDGRVLANDSNNHQ